MIRIAMYVLSFCMMILTCNQVEAADSLPGADQLTTLFLGKTATITNGRPKGKRGGPDKPVKVYFSEMGVVEYLDDQGTSNYRTWSVSDDGLFCVSRNFKRRNQGVSCGTVVEGDNGEYRLYKSKDIKMKSGRVVGVDKKDRLLIFSAIVDGRQL